MKRKGACLLLTIAAAFLISGCWNRRELNELAIAVGMGVDKAGELYRVSIQVVVPREVAGTKGAGHTPVTLYQVEAPSLLEASRKLTTISPRKIYFSHLRVFVVGEAMAREGIAELLDFLNRGHEFRNDFYILVAKGTSAESALKISTSLETIPAVNLFSSLETSEKNWSATMTATLDKFVGDLVSEGKQPVLTGIEVIGDRKTGGTLKNVEQIKSPGSLRVSELAVFKGDKLIGWLNEKESRGYNFVIDNVESSAGPAPCPGGGVLTVETVKSRTRIKAMVADGRPLIVIQVRNTSLVEDVECRNLDLKKPKTISQLEKGAEKSITELIDGIVEKAQHTYKSDIFGFGEAIRRADPKAWKSLKKDWDTRTFPNLTVRIEVDTKIRRTGTISDSLLDKMKE